MGYSIWLGFGGESAEKLLTAISSLAKTFSGPVFQPHLTLVGDLDVDLEEARKFAEIFGKSAMPAELAVRDVEVSTKYFMAMYLAVDIPSELQKTREHIARLANPATYELDSPHVSLLYAEADFSDLARHRDALREEFIGWKLEVAGVEIVQSSKSLPVSDWRTVDTVELYPPATENFE